PGLVPFLCGGYQKAARLVPSPPSTALYRPLPPSTALVCSRIDTHLIPFLVLVLELHHTIDHREQRVVGRPAHVRPRVEFGTALLYENAPRRHELPGERLHAEVLRARITAVAGRTNAL